LFATGGILRTITIQIGNTDNKLSQNDWSHYVEATKQAIEKIVNEVHFFGGSPNWYPWQNVAWVVVLQEEMIPEIKQQLAFVRHSYKQDSVAWTEGETIFV
jgi:hypothetical protein